MLLMYNKLPPNLAVENSHEFVSHLETVQWSSLRSLVCLLSDIPWGWSCPKFSWAGCPGWLTHMAGSWCWLLTGTSAGTDQKPLCGFSSIVVPGSQTSYMEAGTGFPRASLLREPGGSSMAFSDLASEVMPRHFHCILLVTIETLR